MVLNFAQDFLKRITSLSADLATHGRIRTLGSTTGYIPYSMPTRRRSAPSNP